MSTIQIDIVSGEGAIYSGKAEWVAIPGVLGEMDVYPKHAPLLTALRPGALRIKRVGADMEVLFVSGGIAEVQPRTILILADRAVRSQDFDEAQVLVAKRRAEEALKNHGSRKAHAKAEAALAEALAQLDTIRRHRPTARK
ncbi:MAG TPA: F0F1 ATP synthase subunit epsilon [Acidiferrobacter sp.]|nr:F0F1 ATP synthase subunit epsilon [Acidiferrobacter sp.]